MNSINKTLYIPLYGKAFVSSRGIILRDPRAEAIWTAEGFPLKGRSRSKWLAYYMGMRSAVFDRWLTAQLEAHPDAVVLHIGCGLDSRYERVGCGDRLWYDVDLPEVIAERRRYYSESERYHMIASDVQSPDLLAAIPAGGRAVVVMEGVSMYLPPEALRSVLAGWRAHFSGLHLLMDHYSPFAAKASRYKNPINDVGVTQVYGLDDPQALANAAGLTLVTEHDMTPGDLIGQLPPLQQCVFQALYAGKTARRMYQLWEYRA